MKTTTITKKAFTPKKQAWKSRPTSSLQMQSARVGAAAPRTKGTHAERKWVDTVFVNGASAGGGAWSTPAAARLLNGLVPGTGATTRVGRKVTLESIQFKGTVSMAATSTLSGRCRMRVVYDKQSNGAAPAVVDIFEADSYASPNNISNNERFVTLADKECEIGAQGPQIASLDFYKRLGMEENFNAGVAGTIADITSGAIYVLWGDDGRIGVAQPQFNGYFRVRYTDV